MCFWDSTGQFYWSGVKADEGQTPSPVTESIETLSTDLKAGKPSARVLERYGIFFPDGVKHSISMNEIYDGGPGIDGIAALTHPRFIPAGAADYMEDERSGSRYRTRWGEPCLSLAHSG